MYKLSGLEKRVKELEKKVFSKTNTPNVSVQLKRKDLPPLSLLSGSLNEEIPYKWMLELYQSLNLNYQLLKKSFFNLGTE